MASSLRNDRARQDWRWYVLVPCTVHALLLAASVLLASRTTRGTL
ncbi:MAG TPA: hypothetical protein VGR02_21270 [Thermoanaerobaculia bacterium]|nr:hypothetical protein [Thermoanaerobaculia bacterium]